MVTGEQLAPRGLCLGLAVSCRRLGSGWRREDSRGKIGLEVTLCINKLEIRVKNCPGVCCGVTFSWNLHYQLWILTAFV